MQKVLVTTSSFDRTHSELRLIESRFGCRIVYNPYGARLSKAQLLDLVSDDVIAILAGTEQIDAEVFEAAKGLKVISRCGVGAENIDLAAAREHGVDVIKTPDAPTQAVAELTVALILNILRRINSHDTLVKAGSWQRLPSSLLAGKTVGLVGFGRIGQRVAQLLSAFQVAVIYFDTQPVFSSSIQFIRVGDIAELAEKSDIISLHLPCNSETKHMINAGFLDRVKKNAILVNTSRGDLINESDLISHLKLNHDMFAALDVFSEEPYNGELQNLDNVLLTPHIGSFTRESRFRMEKEALMNLIKGVKDIYEQC